MDHIKYGDVFNYGQFIEAYNRLARPANDGQPAFASAPPAEGRGPQPRALPVPGELQALGDLRLGDTAKPPSPRASRKPSASDTASQPRGANRRASVPFEEQVKQDFELWLKGGAPTGQRDEAAARIDYADLEQASTLKLDALALGRIPARVGQFKQLRELRIGSNRLDHFPSAVCRLEQLHTLDARDNLMTELPSGIGRLTALKRLNVDSNQLKGLPRELAQLSRLERFSARDNQLKLVPAQMGALENLRTLDLSHNELWEIPGTWGKLLGLLEDVDLSHNRLQQLPATCEMPARKLTLNVSGNPFMASLPTPYGGFRYGKLRITAADDHKLKNVGGKVTAKTEGTNVRQGLVNEGRLAAGRGIVKGRVVLGRNRPRPAPLHGSDCNSICSELSFVRDHAEPGQLEGLEYVGQDVEADRTWGERRRQAWLEPLAEQYAERHLAVRTSASTLPAEPEPEPEPDLWESARADLFGGHRSVDGPPPSVPAPELRPEFLAALHADFARMPSTQANAIAAYLNKMPQPMLHSALAQLQGGSWARMDASRGGAALSEAYRAGVRAEDATAAWRAADPAFGRDRAV